MKTFKFRMQAILDHRARLETQAQQGLAQSETALRKGEEFLAELRDVRTAILDELRVHRQGQFDPMETKLYQEYLQIVAVSIRDQEKYVADLRGTREASKLHLVERAQDRQALVSVRDRALSAHKIARQQAEQREMDELATARFNHQRHAHD